MENKTYMNVIKRDGTVVEYDETKIANAVAKCFVQIGRTDKAINSLPASIVAESVGLWVEDGVTVEQIQDKVELSLMRMGEYEAAKAYILYRKGKEELRGERSIDSKTKSAFDRSSKHFETPIQQFQFFDKYSRFDYGRGRRETWEETVARSVNFLREISDNKLDERDYQEIFDSILNMEIMPSMRLLAMAGPAARRNHIALYNCSYLPIDSTEAFVEALTISMCGCGVGFSVESEYVNQLPKVSVREETVYPEYHIVHDSSEGWASALRFGIEQWMSGEDVIYNYDNLRPSGAILKTKGGRSSGPLVLKDMLNRIKIIILSRTGQRLRPIDAHDIMCSVGDAAVQGGTRRTAMISLFDFDDYDMLHAKDGDFHELHPQRWNANNSAVWPERELTQEEVMAFFNLVAKGGTGEPGIFNRRAARNTQPEGREMVEFGTNPCGEIILRPNGFCNLTSVVCRENDTLESLTRKVRLATMVGTLQATATNFKGLRGVWAKNAIEERLLGVDLNAHMDSPVVRRESVQRLLRDHAIEVNEEYAKKLGINKAASVTCVKPSGNSSTLLNTASGLHPRWSKYYIRNVRVSAHSPLFHVMKDAGVPMNPENGQAESTATTWVVHFPIKSPDGAIVKDDLTALQKCNYWLRVKNNWTTHNPSVTITYKQDEILDIALWVWRNQDVIGGMAFLPHSDANYEQMPYQEITGEEYEKLNAEFPSIDFSKLHRYESEDMTTAAQELACMSGACEF